MHGSIADFKAVVAFYGYDRLRSEVVQIQVLDVKTVHFLSNLLAVPLSDFALFPDFPVPPKPDPYDWLDPNALSAPDLPPFPAL